MSRSKYNAQKTTVDGITFDSRKEARRYHELKLLEGAGAIKDLRMQVSFQLIPPQFEPDRIGKRGGVYHGKCIEREVKYVADFTYLENNSLVVEDTKGYKTPEYIIKRKLMLYIHGIRIREV